MSAGGTVQRGKIEGLKMFACAVGRGQGPQIEHSTTAILSIKIAIAPAVLITYPTLVDAF